MAYPRVSRLNEEMKKEISDIIRNDLRDPRIAPMTSIIEVDVTKDLSYATVYISVLGNETEKTATLEALVSSKGYVRREIARRIKARITPEILFKLDNSIEKGIEMHKTIAKVSEMSSDNKASLEEEEDNE